MDKKIFITTPIYYVNDVPHMGHAYTTVAADVLARYYKAQDKEVFFLTGTDEHGAKIAEAADKSGKKPKEFVDSLVPRFEKTWENLNIKYNGFIRTTDPKHEEVVKELVSKLKDKGFVEKRKYEGLYCVGCEKYLGEDELVDGKCPDHGKEPIKQSEENYFFLLSKFEDKLKSAIKNNEIEITPESRKNEVLGKIDQGLEDVSISRAAVEWGISFPDDPKQTIYVWIDALINYYSAGKMFNEEKIWPPDIHLMAKDILWFHAVIWPAVLMALDMPLPKKVFAHGFFTIGGKKMSKTLGNVLDPNKMVEKFGADVVRYALLREFPFGEDGDISEKKIADRYNSDLAGGIGNLLNRTLNMIKKYDFESDIKDYFSKKDWKSINLSQYKLLEGEMGLKKELDENVDNLNFMNALVDIWLHLVKTTNGMIDNEKPWELIKNGKQDEAKKVLMYSIGNLVLFSDLIAPFMPETAKKMEDQLKTLEPEPLFPRIEDK